MAEPLTPRTEAGKLLVRQITHGVARLREQPDEGVGTWTPDDEARLESDIYGGVIPRPDDAT